MATLSFKNINKIYDNKVQAVFDFALEVQDKEFIVFVGPSGCGKSTTLRMVAGLEDITSGELYIDGRLINNVVPKDRDIAMVFQSYALYPHMTVYDNMAFALKLRKVELPMYQPNEEVNGILEENKQIRKEIKALNKRFKKQDESAEVLEAREEKYEELNANLARIAKIQEPVMGIDTRKIEKLQKTATVLKAEIAQNEKYIAEKFADDEEKKAVLVQANEQKAAQLEKVEKEIEYHQSTETALTKYRHYTKDEIDIEVNKAAKSLDLTKYLFRKPAALSGGQRQRVALGRAIVRNPKVFLMDEPLSNLDAKLRVQMRSEISKIHERVGATTIYVTHDQTEAMTMASRIVVMKDGYIQQIGTPREVYADPANKFVAGFIGSPAMNFIDGVYANGKFTVSNESESVEIAVPNKYKEMLAAYEGKELTLGARPESIYLADDTNNEAPTAPIDLDCDFCELLGYELVLYTYVAGQKIILKASTKSNVKTHDKIKVSFNENALYFFDKDTTMRIR